MAGVMTPSPYRSAAPKSPSRSSADRPFFEMSFWPTSAISARIPPCPRLSARMTNSRYLNVTTKVIAQKTRERTPSTFSGVGATEWVPPKHSLSAYSGLVPMSP